MLQSMTGFGKSSVTINGIRYNIDIKSLNSKNIDLNIRLPHWMRSVELDMRKILTSALKRGKVDVFINTDILEATALTNLNVEVIKAYMKQMDEISDQLSADQRFQAAMTLPDVMEAEQNEFADQDWEAFQVGLNEALENIQKFRADEGKVLEDDFKLRINNILDLLAQVPAYETERIDRLKQRIHKSLEDFKEVDQDRVEQELVFYLEKLDITEEKVRLKNHCDYFLETMESAESNGKKLNFISQELGREINTLGSKSNHAEMQKLVVDMKDELEKIKEQMLNVL